MLVHLGAKNRLHELIDTTTQRLVILKEKSLDGSIFAIHNQPPIVQSVVNCPLVFQTFFSSQW